ncbi:MAG: response regulator transcription factor [Pedobacter sp.]|nr:response regulator transcription factor [Chitinophagaceae bacterium]
MINVMICDDHSFVREGLENIINKLNGCNVVYKAQNGMEAIEFTKNNTPPDILLLDISLPNGFTGYEVAHYFKKHLPTMKMIACSALTDNMALTGMILEGVKGYIGKDAANEDLEMAINMVYNGDYYFKNIVQQDYEQIIKNDKHQGTIISLTNHELKAAKLMASNLAYKQIADQMGISPNTIDNLRATIFHKLNVTTRIEVVLYMVRMGLV